MQGQDEFQRRLIGHPVSDEWVAADQKAYHATCFRVFNEISLKSHEISSSLVACAWNRCSGCHSRSRKSDRSTSFSSGSSRVWLTEVLSWIACGWMIPADCAVPTRCARTS